MYIISEITDKSIWDEFFNENGSPSFLQSWEWGNFEQKTGYEILRLGFYEDKTLVLIALIIKIKAKRGNFLFVPHGPVFAQKIKNEKIKIKNYIEKLKKYLIDLAKEENYSFIRIAPTLLDTKENLKIFSDLGFNKAPIYMHAERLWVLPLDCTSLQRPLQKHTELMKTDEELLSEMRKTTRYLIRRAERDGVTIEKREDDKVVDDFWKLYEKTAERESFVPFSKKFIKDEYELFKKTGNALFLFGKIPPTKFHPTGRIASALIIFTKSTAFYHQGASIHTKIPVTYLEQWEAIKEAKKRGCKYYNFWGILQPGRTPKNWGGLTLFKQGFGGRQVDYLTTQDYIVSPKYYLTYLFEKFLAWRRGV